MHRRDKATSEKINLPLLFVTLNKTFNIQELYNLDYLCHFCIFIEPHKSKSFWKCYRCQRYCHSQLTCYLDPPSVECTGQHLTAECDKKTRTEPVKCSNYGKNHPANYRGCVIFERLKASRTANSSPKKDKSSGAVIPQDSTSKQSIS